MYIDATIRNWSRRNRSAVTELPAGLQVVTVRHLCPTADRIQIRVDRLIDAVRDATLTIDVTPDDATGLARAITAAVAHIHHHKPYRHPAES